MSAGHALSLGSWLRACGLAMLLLWLLPTPQICANLASSHPSMRVSGHVSHGVLGLFDSQPGGQGWVWAVQEVCKEIM